MFHEGTCEGACDTVTMWADGPDIQGKMTKWKRVTAVKDESTVTFDMYTVADGQETLVMAVVYKKRK